MNKDKILNTVALLKEMYLNSDEWTLIQLIMSREYNTNCYAMMSGNNSLMLCGTSTELNRRQIKGLEALGASCVGTVFSKLPLNALQRKLKVNSIPCCYQHSIEADNGDRIIIIERRSDYI